MPPQITLSNDAPERVPCDAIVVGAYEQPGGAELDDATAALDAALDGALSAYLTERDFKAKVGSLELVPTLGRIAAKAVAVVGLGAKKSISPTEVRKAAGAAAKRLTDRGVVATTLPQIVEDAGAATVEGLLLGSYRYTRFKSDPKPIKTQQLVLVGGAQRDVDRGAAVAEATMLARDLQNEPPNSLTPDALARKAREIADVNGLECTVWDEDEIERRGFGGLAGVARGAFNPPRFIELRYAPEGATGKVALVGKGVTFDSGGLSLKPANAMETMKSDMTGAAVVLATMTTLKKLDVKTEVLGFVPTTENVPSGDSMKPGDVITHYNKTTTEVNNTDAEGRLILADALAYACEQAPDAIVDVATLTGGIMVALGTRLTGMFANDDGLSDELMAAADAAGEPMWRMPLVDDFKTDLDSDVADMKNSGPRWGSAIVAAIFLKQHVKQGIPWAHLDIAGTDWAEKANELGPKGATGVMSRTLVKWLERRGA
ncbi:MAG: leucyl aminopeptidase [Actinobacteria bacterium]|nr:leucyl aminopeptidase [Actinomycetota bacterium]